MSKLDGLIIPSDIIEEAKKINNKKGKLVKYIPDDEQKDEITSFAKSILNEIDTAYGSIHRLAFTTDPLRRNAYAGIYKERLRLLPPHIIKRLIITDDLVAAIFRTRENHVRAFGRPRPSRFDTGFVIEPNQSALEGIESEPNEKVKLEKKEELRKRISAASRVFLNCGYTDGWEYGDKQTFPDYLAQSARNILGMGMMATEVVYKDLTNGNKKFHGFRVIDAGTIFQATPYTQQIESIRNDARNLMEQLKNERFVPEKFYNDEYAWIQVINGRPIQAFTPQECLVHMPYAVPDIEMDGYPVTPLDTVISAVTTHINITTYNKIYFQHGRAARGMLVIHSDDADERVLRNIKQQFNASINGAEKCIAGNVKIFTKNGYNSVAEIVGDKQEVTVDLWTGKKWETGLVYRTGVKKITETYTSNGLSITTSPDHKFLILEDEKGPSWKRQQDLVLGDFVCVNSKPVSSDKKIPNFYGKSIDIDFAEMLGWLSGDGYLGEKSFEMAYDPKSEEWILDKHFKTLKSFNLNPIKKVIHLSKDDQDKICQRYKFKTTSDRQIKLNIYDKKFVNWLQMIGFSFSKERKNVPSFVYTLPDELKFAFLRGLFSADGCNAKLRNPVLFVIDPLMREEVKHLLLSAGIRTTLSEGKTTSSSGINPKLERKSLLRIKDRDLFFDKIGFLQPHKQPELVKNENRRAMKDRVPQNVALFFVKQAKKNKSAFSKRQHLDLDEIIRGERCVSKARLLRILDQARFSPPSWLLDYHFEQIVQIERSEETTEMYDVSVNDEEHAFVGNGMVIHNSWRMPVFSVGQEDDLKWQPIDNSARDMEFQYLTDMNARVILSAFQMSPEELPGWSYLSRGTNSQALSEQKNEYQLEAARDVGIRPLLQTLEDFLNSSIFPLIDKELSEICTIRLMGLDAETAERESIRLQQDQQIHLTMDEILEKVEKRPIGKKWGGEFLFNPNYRQILDQYFTVGQIKSTFFDDPEAKNDPQWAYPRDAFWFQKQQLLQAEQQMQMQQQQMAMAQTSPDPSQQQSQEQEQSTSPVAQPEDKPEPQDELGNAMDTASDSLKSDED